MSADLIEQIRAIIGVEKKRFVEASKKGNEIIPSVMRYVFGRCKYELDGNSIVGLDLTQIQLTDEKWQQILNLPGIKIEGLRALCLSENRLTDFPSAERMTSLQWLDVSENQISDLQFIDHLEQLKHLDFSDNPVMNPSPEIVAQGGDAIRRHFHRLRKAEEDESADYLFEAKVLLVGRTGAGKTSLRYKLRNPDEKMPAENESTRGIDVETLQFRLSDSGSFRMNIWDFEGQQISHQTHQFFLTKRSLYVFVVDQRTEKADVDYWFQIVELLGKESPMMIFQNERRAPGDPSGQICSLNFSGLRKRFGHFLCKGEHRANLDQVAKGKCHKPAQLRAFTAFKDKLEVQLTVLPIVGTKLPRTWVHIRSAIETEARKRAHMPVEDFWSLCRDHGINSTQDQQDLSQLFHDLGVFLHFRSADGRRTLLGQIVILQNEWATKAVYQVLKSEWLRDQNRGHFTIVDLRKIWTKSDYKVHTEELLELMIRFEICYKVAESEVYIAPQILPASPPPDYHFSNKARPVSMLRYSYDFMPKGLITRLAVRMHSLIAQGQTLAWKDGFVLEQNGVIAEVTETYGTREIHIRVSGQHSRRLLNAVAYEIDKLNRAYHFSERIQVHKLLPCTCSDCRNTEEPHFFKYVELHNIKSKGWQQVPCGKTGNPAAIESVLGIILENNEEEWLEANEIRDALREIRKGQRDQTKLLVKMTWLTTENRTKLTSIFKCLEDPRTQENVLRGILETIEKNLQQVLSRLPSNSDITIYAREAIDRMNSEEDIKGKFKWAIPLIPGILSFENEISAGVIEKFSKIWQDLCSGRILI